MRYLLLLLGGLFFFPFISTSNTSESDGVIPSQSLGFIENKGQFADQNGNVASSVLFKTNMQGIDIYITTEGLSYTFYKPIYSQKNKKDQLQEESERSIPDLYKYVRMDMHLKNASIKKENIIAEKPLPGFNQYFYAHCPDGISNVKTYTDITIKEVFPSIDWKIYTNPKTNGLKYDFILHPGANPDDVRLIYQGAGTIAVTDDHISISTALGEVQDNALKTYITESKEEVASTFSLLTAREQETVYTDKTDKKSSNYYEVGIQIEDFDPNQSYTIDPDLTWSTLYGNYAGESATDVVSDGTHVYISAYTSNMDQFFVLSIDPGNGAYYTGTNAGSTDLLIMKATVGGVFVWVTYYGGTREDHPTTMELHNSSLWISGILYKFDIYSNTTVSEDIPLHDMGGNAYYEEYDSNMLGFFILFDTSGARQWATYFPGRIQAMHSTDEHISMTGFTIATTDFPHVQKNAYSYYDTIADGEEAFIVQFDYNGEIVWSTYFGGDSSDVIKSVYESDNKLYITGETYATSSFPLVDPGNGAYYQSTNYNVDDDRDAFIARFDSLGVLTWSSYFGGKNVDYGTCIYVYKKWVWMGGDTESPSSQLANSFPVKKHPNHVPGGVTLYEAAKSGDNDGFIALFDTSGVQVYTSRISGDETDHVTNIAGYGPYVFIGGYTQSGSSSFPKEDPGDGYYFNGTINQGDNDTPGATTGSNDQFFMQLDTNATKMWSSFIGGNGYERGGYLAMDNTWLWIVGTAYLYGSGDSGFPIRDPGDGAYIDTVHNNSAQDLAIHRLGPFEPIIPTPVEWLYFDATTDGEHAVRTSWATATEINNDVFTVLRSSDGVDFKPIGEIDGAGNSSEVLQYSFMDYEPLPGLSYYQLQQTDYDGSTDRSRIVPVLRGTNNHSELNIYPNPLSGNAFVVNLPEVVKGAFTIEIMTEIGQTVAYEEYLDVMETKQVYVQLPATRILPGGLYLLNIATEGKNYATKLVVEGR